MPIVKSQAFQATRKHHRSEAAEDYTELVADLIAEKGEARLVEIAKRLGISHVTAIRTIQRLVRDGYLTTAPHQPIELTAKGKRIAGMSKRRHDILLEFLIALGVPESVAQVDVEGIEHHISPQTLKVFSRHLKKLKVGRLS